MSRKKILVTGGCGYLGSNTAVNLIRKGYDVVIADNLSNSRYLAIQQIEEVTGVKVRFYEGDLCNYDFVEEIFLNEDIYAVIHFAALKSISESITFPVLYYNNNIVSALNLLKVMDANNVRNFIFSSSASVYGNLNSSPIREEGKCEATNPYGNTKIIIENILQDICRNDDRWNVFVFRYFNPIGADISGYFGDNPLNLPNNIMPLLVKAALDKSYVFKVFGKNYKTIDGTGVRDYIHVTDLALGHIAALNNISEEKKGIKIYNLGTGVGYSVLEIINTFELVNNVKINYEFADIRPGDVGECYADPTLAEKDLKWKAKYTLEEMCRDSWQFACKQGWNE